MAAAQLWSITAAAITTADAIPSAEPTTAAAEQVTAEAIGFGSRSSFSSYAAGAETVALQREYPVDLPVVQAAAVEPPMAAVTSSRSLS